MSYTALGVEPCPGGEEWDADEMRCVPVECPEGHEYYLGMCVPVVPEPVLARPPEPVTWSLPPETAPPETRAPARAATNVPLWGAMLMTLVGSLTVAWFVKEAR